MSGGLDSALLTQLVGNVFLPVALGKLDQRDLLRRGEGLQAVAKPRGDLAEDRRRRNGFAQVVAQEPDQATGRCQRRDVAVQVQPIDALDFERHVTAKQFFYGRHPVMLSPSARGGQEVSLLVGLRPEASLVHPAAVMAGPRPLTVRPLVSRRRPEPCATPTSGRSTTG